MYHEEDQEFNNNDYQVEMLEDLSYDWEQFVNVVKHNQRSIFLHPQAELRSKRDNSSRIVEFLSKLYDFCADHHLFRQISDKEMWYRGRGLNPSQSGSDFGIIAGGYGPRELGPAPAELCNRENRMSPSWIPMFYGSSNIETAVSEILGRREYIFGEFHTIGSPWVLDLSLVSKLESCSSSWYEVRFLESFCHDISVPFDEESPGFYVPSQVISDYFRSMLTPNGNDIDGIIFPSSHDDTSLTCALFAQQSDVIHEKSTPYYDGHMPWLRMSDRIRVSYNTKTMSYEHSRVGLLEGDSTPTSVPPEWIIQIQF
jgi:hypothetical protein